MLGGYGLLETLGWIFGTSFGGVVVMGECKLIPVFCGGNSDPFVIVVVWVVCI